MDRDYKFLLTKNIFYMKCVKSTESFDVYNYARNIKFLKKNQNISKYISHLESKDFRFTYSYRKSQLHFVNPPPPFFCLA